jgi:hypothetical protein
MFIFNGLKAQVTITGSVSLPAPSASQVPKTFLYGGLTPAGITAGTGVTIGAITAGKTFYCTQAFFYNTSGDRFLLKDGGLGGTDKLFAVANGDTQFVTVTMPTPIAFSTSVFCDVVTTGNCSVCLTGFEQ